MPPPEKLKCKVLKPEKIETKIANAILDEDGDKKLGQHYMPFPPFFQWLGGGGGGGGGDTKLGQHYMPFPPFFQWLWGGGGGHKKMRMWSAANLLGALRVNHSSK